MNVRPTGEQILNGPQFGFLIHQFRPLDDVAC